MRKIFFMTLMIFLTSCGDKNIKYPELPDFDRPTFSYEDALAQEKILLKRSEEAKSQFKSRSQ